MSRTLNLVDCLLARGRKYQELGCTDAALHVLTRLSSLRTLGSETCEDVQVRLAELHLSRKQYPQARRHLSAALARRPNNARYHYLLAAAYDQDEDADPQDACRHYHLSLKIDPEQPDCLSDFGLLILSFGEQAQGLRSLRRAVELAPDDPDIIAKLVEGLCELEKIDEARRVLQAALFRNSRDLRFRRLWQDFQFQQLCAAQSNEQSVRWGVVRTDRPILLPFVRPARPKSKQMAKGKVIRHDDAAAPSQPHRPRGTRVRKKKQA
jgi:Tfp pilus assembly protein PilF